MKPPRTRGLPLALLIAGFALSAATQRPPATQRIPVETPPGWPQQRAATGLPWPAGLGKKEALTGHIAAMDKDQVMVRSLDYGEVLFWVDERTAVRVDKFPLSLADLQVGDPVAVRLKNVKGRGPYAIEILPHPDVRARKLKKEAGAAGAQGGFVSPDTAAPELPNIVTAPSSAQAEMPAPPQFPALPAGAAGVVGTVGAVGEEWLELRDANDQVQRVLLTGVTRVKHAESERILPGVKTGDRVAVIGDRLDSGEWIAREVLVAQETASGAEPGVRPPAGAPPSEALSEDRLARFSGTVVWLGSEELRVRTPRGEQTVLVTGVTEIRRMGMRGNFASLRAGDEVSVVGDVLEGGVVLARQITVTKLAGS